MKTLFEHCRILTMDEAFTEYEDGWLLAQDGLITALGEGPFTGACDERVDGEGGILMPGMVNLHCHASMVPFRTMGDDCPDRLKRFLFPLENEAMTPELAYLGARAGMAEMLLAGVTTFVDMYYFEDAIARACVEMGMRGYLGETVIGQRSPDAAGEEEGLRLCEAMLQKWRGHPLVRPIVAPHGTTTVSAEGLCACHRLAEAYGTLMTLHAAEMDDEMSQFVARGTTPIAFLRDLGCVDGRLLAAHCTHLSAEDTAILAEGGARVAHCPGSNLKAGKGVCPVRDLEAAGVTWGLGTDGPSSGNTLSLFDQMRLCPMLQKTKYHDRSLMPARRVVLAATRGGAEALNAGAEFGALKLGLRADAVLVSTRRMNMFPLFNPYAALVYGAGSADVDTVMTGGVIRVRRGRLTQLDEDALRRDLARAMGPFARAAQAYRDMI